MSNFSQLTLQEAWLVTMNVSIPSDLADYVNAEVKGGRYASAGEMIRFALRQLKALEKVQDQVRVEEEREVRLGWDDVDAGRVEDFDPDVIKAAGRERLAKSS